MLPFCSPKLDERLLRVLDTLNVKLHPRLRNADDIGAHLRHEFVRSLIETGESTSCQTHAVVYFGPNPTSGQYSQGPGTQRKTSPATATWQTHGNGR